MTPIPVILGETYGRLTAISHVDGSRSLFRCLCGTEVVLPNKHARSGNTKSCGCLHKERAVNLSWSLGKVNHSIQQGEIFGRLTAMTPVSAAVTRFRCDCGTEKVARNLSVRSGAIQSCGCLQVERCGKRIKSQGGHAYRRTPEYRVWVGMRYRCTNPNNPAWKYYGGKGIKIDPAWGDFRRFLSDMGPRPDGYSIDRIDGSRDYCKENCRWADIYQQNQNRGFVEFLTVWGETQRVPAWAHEFGLSPQTLRKRLKRGVNPEIALTTPPGGLYV